MLHSIPALLLLPALQLLLGHGQHIVVQYVDSPANCAAAVIAIATDLVEWMVKDEVLDLSKACLTCRQMKREYFGLLKDVVRM